MEKNRDESVFSLPISSVGEISVFGIWVGETIVTNEWKRYRFEVAMLKANIFKVRFPDGRERICSIDRGTIVEIGKPFSFFINGQGRIKLPEVRYIKIRRKIKSPVKSPPPIPEDALEDVNDGS